MASDAESIKMDVDALRQSPPDRLFASPIDYILADHYRQRSLCRVLDAIADPETINGDLVTAALQFLESEFGPHVIDEEADLFPILRARAHPDDEVGEMLDDLLEEHAADKQDADQIIAGLAKIADSDNDAQPTSSFCDLLRRFSANERRHLIVENAIILPLARARLAADDLRTIGRRMAARRGIDYPE